MTDTLYPNRRSRAFATWMLACSSSDEFIAEYCNLTGERFTRTPIEKMIDEAAGNTGDRQAEAFIDFCWELFVRILAVHDAPTGDE